MPLSPKVVIIEKPGLRVAGASRGLLVILLAVDRVTRDRIVPGCPRKIRWVAGSNGKHSKKGPHYMPRCEAGDFGSKEFATDDSKRHWLHEVALAVNDGPIIRVWEQRTKIVTANFFFWLEKLGLSAEHFHLQTRKGHTIR